MVARHHDRRCHGEVGGEDGGHAGGQVGHNQGEIEAMVGLDARRNAGRAETARRRDAP
jgi:hypothetical protein